MRKLGIFILGLLLSCQVYASPAFDIFGVDDHAKQRIYACCSKIIEQYLKESQKLNFALAEPGMNDMVHLLKFEERIAAKVKQVGDFAEVKLSTIYYPSEKQTFATLDIVKQNERFRIPDKNKLQHPTKKVYSHDVKKLFQIWDSYNAKKMRLIKSNTFDSSKATCPVIHCTWGFDQDELKSILPKLQAGVIQHKKELFTILKNSQDDKERAEAIFILANDTEYQKLANFLVNYVDDSSELVRNNVMRVLGAILAKNKLPNLDITKVLQALNYPYVTDRNKAAYVLLNLIKSDPSIHAQVTKQAGHTLIELLKLKQPNNHDYAYLILKELSHKNYSEYDYKNWSKWIDERQNSNYQSG